MEYNTCRYCGANNGRAGILFCSEKSKIDPACENCWDTLRDGIATIHTHLSRTDDEINITLNLLNQKEVVQ